VSEQREHLSVMISILNNEEQEDNMPLRFHSFIRSNL